MVWVAPGRAQVIHLSALKDPSVSDFFFYPEGRLKVMGPAGLLEVLFQFHFAPPLT